MPGDELAQQLARLVDDELDSAWERANLSTLVVQAMLESGLVVPTSDVLNLAQKWEDMAPVLDMGSSFVSDCAAELRALTQQETK